MGWEGDLGDGVEDTKSKENVQSKICRARNDTMVGR
jgi:hypothetical protein